MASPSSLTATELVSWLRGHGYSVIRSVEPHYVIIPRIEWDDPVAERLAKLDALLTPYAPDQWGNPSFLVYEANLMRCRVEGSIWEAAAP